jgi:predicted DNA-binding protein
MKKTAFIKVRTTPERLQHLKERAGKAGKPVSTYADEQIERALESAQQSEELAELRSQVQELVALVQTLRQPSQDAETQTALRELRLTVRELAMHTNAQILARVAAQLKTQPNS